MKVVTPARAKSFNAPARGNYFVGAGTFKAVAILSLTLLAYLPALRAGFVWDDDTMLTANPFIKLSNGLWYIWGSTALPDYFPLTSSSLWLEWRLWGMNATGYHLTNIVLHAASAVVLWRVLLRLHLPGAWLVSLVYALHPVNVESVAWIAERKNTLSLFFGAFATLLYLRSEQAKKFNYWLAMAAFLLALLSKTSVVMLPFVLLGFSWWQRGRITWRDILRSAPFFLLSLIFGLVTIWFQYHRAIGNDIISDANFVTRLVGAGWAVGFYFSKALWPLKLSFVYPQWQISPRAPTAWLPLAVLGLGFILGWKYRQRWGRAWLLGIGAFVLMLLPVLGFLNIYFLRYAPVADHWQYFGLIGIVALIIGGATRLLQRWEMDASPKHKGIWLWRGRLLGAAVVITFGLLTWKQTLIYADDETLWRDTLTKNPDSWLALNNLGLVAAQKGNYAEARTLHLQSLQARPVQVEAHNNLGEVLLAEGKLAEAKEHYLAALKLDPRLALTHYNLGNLLDHEGKTVDAIAAYRRAIELAPLLVEAHNNLGCLLAAQGKLDEAIIHFREAIRIRPEFLDSLNNLASVLLEQNHPADAVPLLVKAILIKPDYADAHYNLGNARFALKQPREAFAEYQSALGYNPRHGMAHYKIANMFFYDGNVATAAQHFQAAITLNPTAAEPHYQFATLLAQRKEMTQAVEQYRAAVRLKPEWVEALNNLAWIYATHSDAKIRDGKAAVELASRAVELTRTNDPGTLDTLAAAYAEAGQWPLSIEAANRALALAGTTNQTFSKQIAARLRRFEAGQNYRE